MSGNIEELTDYLGLYKVLLEGGYYNKEYEEDAKDLLMMIDKLDDPIARRSYDFNALKRKVSKVFHPDRYTSFNTEALGVNNKELISKVNGVLDEIIRDKKNSTKCAVEVDASTKEEEDFDFTKNDFFGFDHKFDPKPKSEEELRKELRKEKISQTIQTIKNETIRTRDYVCTLARDRFNAVFRNIPSNTKDYIFIKKRFEDTLLSLSYREKLIEGSLSILYQAKSGIEEAYNKEISGQALTYYYNNLMSNLKRAMDIASQRLETAKAKYYHVFGKYEPEYRELMGKWVQKTSEINADLFNVNSAIREEANTTSEDKALKGLIKMRKKLLKDQEKQSKYEEEKEKIKTKMLIEHPDLDEVYSSYTEEKEALNKAREQYTYTASNAKAVKLERLKEIATEYARRNVDIDYKIRKLEQDCELKKAKIFKTRTRYNEFLDRYQNKYENTLEYDDNVEVSVRR